MTKVVSQTSLPKGIQPQSQVTATEQPPGKQTGNERVPFLSCSNSCPTDIPESEEHKMTTLTKGTTIQLFTITTPLIEQRLVRDRKTNELYLPITSTVVLKRKQEMLHVSLDFQKNLRVHALADSRAYVSAIAQNEMDTLNQKAPSKIIKTEDPSFFQKKWQMAS